jgi:hypothetical protein
MVPKKNGSWRPCDDYRRLNTITVPDRYPLPNMLDLSANMDGYTVFSKSDRVKASHQVPIAPEDGQKTAVITPFGLFEYNYMHFGLCKIHIQNVPSRNDPSQNGPSHKVPSLKGPSPTSQSTKQPITKHPITKRPRSLNDPSRNVPEQYRYMA